MPKPAEPSSESNSQPRVLSMIDTDLYSSYQTSAGTCHPFVQLPASFCQLFPSIICSHAAATPSITRAGNRLAAPVTQRGKAKPTGLNQSTRFWLLLDHILPVLWKSFLSQNQCSPQPPSSRKCSRNYRAVVYPLDEIKTLQCTQILVQAWHLMNALVIFHFVAGNLAVLACRWLTTSG